MQLKFTRSWGRRFFAMMKLITFILLIACTTANARNGYGQKISLSANDAPLAKVFHQIERQTHYQFLFFDADLQKAHHVNLRVKNATLQDVLQQLFKNQQLVYTISNSTIVVKRRQVPSTSLPAIIPDVVVNGQVRDSATGTPLIGVTIKVKGASIGTTTDENGQFSLNVPDNAVLVVSYIGYNKKEIPVNGRTTFDISLSASTTSLDQLVVVGYGTQKKSDITGAVSVVEAKSIKDVPATNLQDALIGKVAGALIQQAGGANPTGGTEIRIRGINSLNGAANNPLYVVDGIPLFDNNLNTIDPDNIASVSVLKDASATAIYGARAAAGVILITTKKGEKGQGMVTASVEMGTQDPYKYYDVINSSQWYKLMESGWDTYEYLKPGVNRNNMKQYTDFFTPAIWDSANNRPLYNVVQQKTLLRINAPWKKYTAGISGGTDQMDYYFNIGYEDRKGIMVQSGVQRYSLSANVNYQVNDKLKTGFSLNASYVDNSGIGGLNDRFGSYFPTVYFPQFYPIKKAGTGEWVVPSQEWKVDPAYNILPFRGQYTGTNELYDLTTSDNKNVSQRSIENFYFEYSPIRELKLKTNVGIDYNTSNNKSINYLKPAEHLNINNPSGMDNVSTSVYFDRQLSYVINETVSYDKSFGKHNIDATGVAEIQNNYGEYLSITANGSADNDLDQISNQPQIDVPSPNGTIINPRTFAGSPTGRQRFASFMGRINYNYADKYFLTATVREDGSSKFATGNKWGTFPSLALSWKMHNEDFFEPLTKIFSQFKPRFSIGTTGNQASIGNFLYIPTVSTATGVYGNYAWPDNLANKNLTWESVRQWDLGIDLGLFNNRVSFSGDYYNKKSINMLSNVPLTVSSGYGSAKGNTGSIQNKGFEFTLNTINISNNNFSWNTDITFSLNRNKILDLGVDASGGKIDSVIVDKYIRVVGQPVSNYFLYSYDGVWQEKDDPWGPRGLNQVGLFRVKDRNNDHQIDQNDRKIEGSPLPKFSGGFTNTISYKDVTLNVVCTYMVGNRLFNNVKPYLESGHMLINVDQAFYKNHWTPSNPTNDYQRMSTMANNASHFQSADIDLANDHWLENASFLKIAAVNLYYNIPKRVISFIGLKSARLGFTATDLFTFTKYSGLDPETDGRIASGDPSVAGVDNGGYPAARTFLVHLNLNF